MSTRALYTFRDSEGAWNVYKHHDGYPTGAAKTLHLAVDKYAWPLPRFEADEFATAFCAAGKPVLDPEYLAYRGGGVRLMPKGKPATVAQRRCTDIEYRYEISLKDRALWIKAFTGSWGGATVKEQVIFNGPFTRFISEAEQLDRA